MPTPREVLHEIVRQFISGDSEIVLPNDLYAQITSAIAESPKKLVPKTCPVCQGPLVIRKQMTSRVAGRRQNGRRSVKVPIRRYVCETCKVSVVLHTRIPD